MTGEYRDIFYHVNTCKHACGLRGYRAWYIDDEGTEHVTPWQATRADAAEYARRSIGQYRRRPAASVPTGTVMMYDATPTQAALIRAERQAAEERRRQSYDALTYPPEAA